MNIKIKKENQKQIELVAERFAYILIQQVQIKQNRQIKNQMENKYETIKR